jgi:hypothetical protein
MLSWRRRVRCDRGARTSCSCENARSQTYSATTHLAACQPNDDPTPRLAQLRADLTNTYPPSGAHLGLVTITPTDPWATYPRDIGALPSSTKSRGTSSHCHEVADVDRQEVGAAGPVGSGLVEVGEHPRS